MLHVPMTANASITFSYRVLFVCKIPSIYNGISNRFQASMLVTTRSTRKLRIDSICIIGCGSGTGLESATGCQRLDSCTFLKSCVFQNNP